LIVRSGGEEESSGGKPKREADRGSSFTFTGRKRVQLLTVYRTLRLVGAPYTLPPGTPRDRVMILQDSMRKAFKDAEFHREYKNSPAKTPIRSCRRDGESDQRNAAQRRSDRTAEKSFREGPASRALNAS
jgi:hypothetical protein